MRRYISILIFIISTPIVYYRIILPEAPLLLALTTTETSLPSYIESDMPAPEEPIENISVEEMATIEITPEDEIDYAVMKLTTAEKLPIELNEFLDTIKTITEDQNHFITSLAKRNNEIASEKYELEEQIDELIAVIQSQNNSTQNQLLGGWSGVFVSGIIGYFISSIWVIPFRVIKYLKTKSYRLNDEIIN